MADYVPDRDDITDSVCGIEDSNGNKMEFPTLSDADDYIDNHPEITVVRMYLIMR
jgi:hypothetical protein